ncbi:MAG: O-acetyl-ADP-ribose deacetylase [Candidatus Omnitrophica bacterium]|nr:O-acetyl-ADP-ribose deacetylase [Candidatus Omnitrophota bacterium]
MKFDRIEITEGDITSIAVDAIVNAANNSLLGGGGVDGAIHRAAGPGLLEECRRVGGCATGEAKITKGYNLQAEWVIHTVGPVWRGGIHGEELLLGRCYESCFRFVEPYRIKTIAFPSISTGAYRFPLDAAVPIALAKIKECLEKYPSVDKVMIVCFNTPVYDTYRSVLFSR